MKLHRKKLIELNEKILEKAVPKVERAIMNDKWDKECFDTMSEAIKNIYKLEIIEKGGEMVEEYKERKEYEVPKTRMKDEDKTDFEMCVDEIIEKHGYEKGMKVLMKVLNELMEEDLRLIHTRMYENTMRKLKELK